jgi:hypothetical protein
LHSNADIAAIAAKVAANEAPWLDGWNRLNWNSRSSVNFVSPRTAGGVIERGSGLNNVATMYIDAASAYQTALQWRVGGKEAHGAKSAKILNAWSNDLTRLGGNADRFLMAGLQGYQFAATAELMRDHPDFNLDRFIGMLNMHFYPMNSNFLIDHNGAFDSNYWANWDLCNMASVLAIGGVSDDQSKVDEAIDYFYNGKGMGSIKNLVPYLHEVEEEDGTIVLGQMQESGRDQGHAVMCVGLIGAFCEMAWNLGEDCYGADDNRVLKGVQYVAKYNLGEDVPYTTYWQQRGNRHQNASHTGWTQWPALGAHARGHVRPVWESLLGHYSGRKGLDARWVQKMAETHRAEGGGGDYGSASGGFDQLGFGTLMYYREYVAPVPGNDSSPDENQNSQLSNESGTGTDLPEGDSQEISGDLDSGAGEANTGNGGNNSVNTGSDAGGMTAENGSSSGNTTTGENSTGAGVGSDSTSAGTSTGSTGGTLNSSIQAEAVSDSVVGAEPSGALSATGTSTAQVGMGAALLTAAGGAITWLARRDRDNSSEP